MMRPLLSFVLCSAIAAPGLALAQDIPNLAQLPAPAATPPEPALAPLPTVAPTEPAAPPVTAPPPPSAEAGAPAPELAPPTTVAPVIVAKDDKGNGISGKVGTVAAGVAGGAAGAAVAGPVGKFAGGFLAKQLAQGVFGKKDKTTELTVIPQTPSAAGAAAPAVAQAEASPKTTLVAEER
jgi:hypothetical protein